jgi:hypothetical protein
MGHNCRKNVISINCSNLRRRSAIYMKAAVTYWQGWKIFSSLKNVRDGLLSLTEISRSRQLSWDFLHSFMQPEYGTLCYINQHMNKMSSNGCTNVRIIVQCYFLPWCWSYLWQWCNIFMRLISLDVFCIIWYMTFWTLVLSSPSRKINFRFMT